MLLLLLTNKIVINILLAINTVGLSEFCRIEYYSGRTDCGEGTRKWYILSISAWFRTAGPFDTNVSGGTGACFLSFFSCRSLEEPDKKLISRWDSERKLFTTTSSTTFTQCAPEATEFGEITQNKDRYAVQGHSRSPILVPIETAYTTYISD